VCRRASNDKREARRTIADRNEMNTLISNPTILPCSDKLIDPSNYAFLRILKSIASSMGFGTFEEANIRRSAELRTDVKQYDLLRFVRRSLRRSSTDT
jgi:hypothetical protein